MASDISLLRPPGMRPGFVLVHRVHQGRCQHACERSTATAASVRSCLAPAFGGA